MKRQISWILSFLAMVCIVGYSPSVQADPRPYAVIDLGDLGKQQVSSAFGLNDQGSVVGGSFLSTGDFHPMIWRNGVLTDLNPSLFDDGEAWGINEAEQIVGWARFDENFDEHAFLWEDGVMLDLGTLGGAWSRAYAINNAGQIVGEAEFTYEHKGNWPFIWENGVMRSLIPECDECRGEAWDINDAGQIVGYATIPDLNLDRQPVLWNPDGEMIVLYDEDDGAGRGINNHGEIVGKVDGVVANRAVMWESDGTMIVLDAGGSYESVAKDINDHSIIVGQDGTPKFKACLWDAQRHRYTLNDIIAPRNKWRIDSVWEINNHNQIAARGRTQKGNARYAFLLTPVTPRFGITEPTPAIAGEMNEITAHGGDLEPGMRVNFYWGVHGGGTMFPTSSCDILDAVLQIENAKWAGSAIVDENGVATLRGTVPAIAKDEILLFQAMVPARFTADNKCMQSSYVIVQFE